MGRGNRTALSTSFTVRKKNTNTDNIIGQVANEINSYKQDLRDQHAGNIPGIKESTVERKANEQVLAFLHSKDSEVVGSQQQLKTLAEGITIYSDIMALPKDKEDREESEQYFLNSNRNSKLNVVFPEGANIRQKRDQLKGLFDNQMKKLRDYSSQAQSAGETELARTLSGIRYEALLDNFSRQTLDELTDNYYPRAKTDLNNLVERGYRQEDIDNSISELTNNAAYGLLNGQKEAFFQISMNTDKTDIKIIKTLLDSNELESNINKEIAARNKHRDLFENKQIIALLNERSYGSDLSEYEIKKELADFDQIAVIRKDIDSDISEEAKSILGGHLSEFYDYNSFEQLAKYLNVPAADVVEPVRKEFGE